MNGSPAVECRGLTRVFGEGDLAVRAVDGIDLTIEHGQFVVGVDLDLPAGVLAALKGRSGSGKTTLLNLIGGIDEPTSGSITVAGQDITELDSKGRTAFRRDHVGFVFQFFNLIPTLTALENVKLITDIAGVEDGAAASSLESVGLGDRLDNFPSGLSGGEQQRVAVARAVAKTPPLILGDEPTGSLDLETGRQVLDLLHRLNHERDITMLLVTHSSVIAEMADRVLKLRDGRIVDDLRVESPKSAFDLVW
jgi:putative ABC transport system ATP-binding protein